jgi:competence protein ComEC
MFFRPSRIFFIFLALLIPPPAFSGPAEDVPVGPGDLYRAAYNDFRRGERDRSAGDPETSLEYFQSARSAWEEIRGRHPDWNPETVEQRLRQAAERIDEAKAQLAEKRAWETPLRVHFIDVGQGDSALVQCPDGSTILIDGGPMGAYPHLVSYLKEVGVEKIDLLIATHPDGDHIGGLIKVLQTFPVTTVLDPGKEHTTLTYQRYMEAVKGLPDTGLKVGRAGDRYTFGEVNLQIIHPGSRLPGNNNDCSIVARLTYGGQSFLFTGDAEKKAEAEMMSRGFPVKSSVLKVGHHGSRSSTSPRFLSSVAPKSAVISCGENNRWGHPTEEVMRSLKQRNIEIYQTDLQGTILMVSDGKETRVEFPGKAVYPDYPVPEEYERMIIANRVSLIYYLPESRYRLKAPPEDREYFKTGAEAEAAGYYKSWN